MNEKDEQGDSAQLTHADAQGRVRMVDVGHKPPMHREASAEAYFIAKADTLDVLEQGALPKGEALAAARLAGIMAAKRCDELIPLCHSLPLSGVEVDFERAGPDRLRIVATARTVAATGVEMEALTAASVAALTLWDMTKGVDAALHVDGVRLVRKMKEAVEGD